MANKQTSNNEAPSTAAARFQLAAKRVRDSHGGRPSASLVDGKIVFTYPDGTQTGQEQTPNGNL